MEKVIKLEGIPTYTPDDPDLFKIEKRVYEGKEVEFKNTREAQDAC